VGEEGVMVTTKIGRKPERAIAPGVRKENKNHYFVALIRKKRTLEDES